MAKHRIHARILVLLVGVVQVLFSGSVPGAADERGVAGLLGILDVESGRVLHRCEYRPAGDLYGGPRKLQFTGFGFAEGRLWVCSFGEIVGFDDWPPRRPCAHITLPSFNDLHHCRPWRGALAVANTGLETVDLVSFEGELLERLSDGSCARIEYDAGSRNRYPERRGLAGQLPSRGIDRRQQSFGDGARRTPCSCHGCPVGLLRRARHHRSGFRTQRAYARGPPRAATGS